MEETVIISVKNAQTAYDKADKPGKDLLLNLIGEDVLLRNITDRAKTFKDVLAIAESAGYVKESMRYFLDYSGDDKDMLSAVALIKLGLVAKVLNEGWMPDWSEGNNQWKYYPWFKVSGSRLSYGDCGYTRSAPGVGSRLVFKTRELAEFAGRTFIDLYSDLLINT